MKSYYYESLKLLDYKDEYWNEVKDIWFSLNLKKESLEYLHNIAIEKDSKEIASAIDIYSRIGGFNEFENILISGNVAGLRSIITDADYFLTNGYSTDEIRLIQESSRNRFDFKSDDYLSIANRIYAFQKNKNGVAELYYMLSMSYEPKLAALGLVSIYEAESREVELCSLFEKYLLSDESDTSTHIKEAYLSALFKNTQYKKYYEYYEKNKNDVDADEKELLKVLLELDAPEGDIVNVASKIKELTPEM